MDHRKKLAALAALTLCAGCATARWSVVQQFRTPGEKLETFPEQVWEEYFEGDWDKLNGFVTVDSHFYPELGAWYAEREEVWLEHAKKMWEEENEEEWGAS